MLHGKRGGKFAMFSPKQSESADFDWAVRFHRVALKAVGIWPEIYQNSWKKLLIDLYCLIGVLAILMFVLLPCLSALYYSRHDMVAIVDNLQFTVPMAGALVKYFDAWSGKTDLTAVIQEILDDWTKPKDPQEQEVMVSQARLCQTILKITTVLTVTTGVVLVGSPCFGFTLRQNLDTEERLLSLPSRFFFDVNVSPNYELAYFAQSYASIFAAASYTSVDNLIVFLILHIRGQLRNLRSRMLNLARPQTFQSDLIFNVHDHIRLLSTMDTVDNVFTRTFAGVLLYFTMCLCMNALMTLYLVQMDDDIGLLRLIFIWSMIVTTFGHAIVYCIMGEMLGIECEEIYNAVCASEWEELKPDDVKKLLIVMAYTSRPIYFTAVKIVPMNMSTFCTMLQMTASYVSFLLAKLK